MYLQVIMLANITLAEGTYILPEVKEGDRVTGRRSTLDWPCQGKPNSASWKQWKELLLSTLECKGKLVKPLGNRHMRHHQQWEVF